jgi:hypothetical protein
MPTLLQINPILECQVVSYRIMACFSTNSHPSAKALALRQKAARPKGKRRELAEKLVAEGSKAKLRKSAAKTRTFE